MQRQVQFFPGGQDDLKKFDEAGVAVTVNRAKGERS